MAERSPTEVDPGGFMKVLTIVHRTIYRYRDPVPLGPHRLVLRPRDSHELRVVSSRIDVDPPASLSWANDVFGNAVATASFSAPSDHLVIDSRATVELAAAQWPVFDIAGSAITYPFRYSDEELVDLAELSKSQYPDPDAQVAAWAEGFVDRPRTDTLSMLKDLAAGTAARVRYQSREEEGTQSPQQSLARGWGSCRDIAVLFAEAARSLGFGVRLISGYLYRPDQATWSSDAGSTHAWTEVYLPGSGWVAIDPTNGTVGGYDLVPVAVGRTMAQVMPVSGTFWGDRAASLGMSVEVQVTATDGSNLSTRPA
jgi:transglutaminase-like putative cysteine protease